MLGSILVWYFLHKNEFVVKFKKPRKPNFFEYFLIYISANYKDRNKSLEDILHEEFDIKNYKIFFSVFLDLVEANIIDFKNITAIEKNTDYFKLPLTNIFVNKDFLEVFNTKEIINSNKTEEVLSYLYYDELFQTFTNDKTLIGKTTNYKNNLAEIKLPISQTTDFIIEQKNWFNFIKKYSLQKNMKNNFTDETIVVNFSKSGIPYTNLDLTTFIKQAEKNKVYEQLDLYLDDNKNMFWKANNSLLAQKINMDQTLKNNLIEDFFNKNSYDILNYFNLSSVQFIDYQKTKNVQYLLTNFSEDVLAKSDIIFINLKKLNLLDDDKLNYFLGKYISKNIPIIVFNNKDKIKFINKNILDFKINLPDDANWFVGSYSKNNFQAFDVANLVINEEHNLFAINKINTLTLKDFYEEIVDSFNENKNKFLEKINTNDKNTYNEFAKTFILDFIDNNNNNYLRQVFMLLDQEGFQTDNKVLYEWEKYIETFYLKNEDYKYIIKTKVNEYYVKTYSKETKIYKTINILRTDNTLELNDFLRIIENTYENNFQSTKDILQFTKALALMDGELPKEILVRCWRSPKLNFAKTILSDLAQNHFVYNKILDINSNEQFYIMTNVADKKISHLGHFLLDIFTAFKDFEINNVINNVKNKVFEKIYSIYDELLNDFKSKGLPENIILLNKVLFKYENNYISIFKIKNLNITEQFDLIFKKELDACLFDNAASMLRNYIINKIKTTYAISEYEDIYNLVGELGNKKVKSYKIYKNALNFINENLFLKTHKNNSNNNTKEIAISYKSEYEKITKI